MYQAVENDILNSIPQDTKVFDTYFSKLNYSKPLLRKALTNLIRNGLLEVERVRFCSDCDKPVKNLDMFDTCFYCGVSFYDEQFEEEENMYENVYYKIPQSTKSHT